MKKQRIILIGIIILGVILLLSVSFYYLSKTKTLFIENNNYSERGKDEEIKNSNVNGSNEDSIDSKSPDVINNTQDNASSKSIDVKEDTKDNDSSDVIVDYTKKDNLVIHEMEKALESVNSLKNNDTFSDKAKATFVNVVDFLFYDGSINDVTFKELSSKGKEKVLKLAYSIDMKLEEKVPGYKDNIASKTGSAYNKASEVIKNGAYNLNNFTKEKLGDENYNLIIDAKDELTLYTKDAFSLIKNASSNILSSSKEKLNSWYQNFKNN